MISFVLDEGASTSAWGQQTGWGSAGIPAEAHPRLKSRLLVVGGELHLHKAKQLRAKLQLISLIVCLLCLAAVDASSIFALPGPVGYGQAWRYLSRLSENWSWQLANQLSCEYWKGVIERWS
jgi:hypothetical protein